MRLDYDEEGDVLEVIFEDGAPNRAEAGYELHKGIVLYTTAEMSPVQLTLVSFRRLIQQPVIHFNELEKQPDNIRKKLIPVLGAPPLSALLRIDPVTNYGHITSPDVLDLSAQAA